MAKQLDLSQYYAELSAGAEKARQEKIKASEEAWRKFNEEQEAKQQKAQAEMDKLGDIIKNERLQKEKQELEKAKQEALEKTQAIHDERNLTGKINDSWREIARQIKPIEE